MNSIQKCVCASNAKTYQYITPSDCQHYLFRYITGIYKQLIQAAADVP